METRQRYLKIRTIFNEVIEAEVRSYMNSEKSKITFFNIKGGMQFLDKYQLIGDGDGDNEVLKQIDGRNTFNEAPTFIIPTNSHDGGTFWLHLERPDIERDDRSYFVKESREKAEIYRLYGEVMLENEEFKSCILQMIEDIAPQRLQEIRQVLA